MKRFFISALFLWISTHQAVSAADRCIVIQEFGSRSFAYHEGDFSFRTSPCSTFKIALSLMGYDAGILINEFWPEWPYDELKEMTVVSWKRAQTPKTWIQNSCIWYSQALTARLGADLFQHYVASFRYGNQDISGDFGKNNGLSHCWLSSSLAISPQEQIEFLEQLLKQRLPCSLAAHGMTQHLLRIEEMENGWQLYGKAGSGWHNERSVGWFVGWAVKDERTVLFACRILDSLERDRPAGGIAKDEMIFFLKTYLRIR